MTIIDCLTCLINRIKSQLLTFQKATAMRAPLACETPGYKGSSLAISQRSFLSWECGGTRLALTCPCADRAWQESHNGEEETVERTLDFSKIMT